MRLSSLKIKNFRGVREGNFDFCKESRLICVIGSGDSGKSTLLTAIEWALWPSYSLTVSDLDFYNGDVSKPIMIEASVAEVPEELLKEEKFGLYLRDAKAAMTGRETDEPIDGSETVITVRLTVDDSLEPSWTVVTNRTEPKTITQKERRRFSIGSVGLDYDKDFQWGKGSVLHKYAEDTNTLKSAYTQAMRNAVGDADLSGLNSTNEKIKTIGPQYGVSFQGELSSRIMMTSGKFSTSAGIFDDRVPFAMRGLGSKRLLSIGMNVNAVSEGSLILVDEVETGLEPYRICTLIQQLRKDVADKGQVIMTTHSSSAVRECTAEELYVMYTKGGTASWHRPTEITIGKDVQAIIRETPEAFLCKRIVVCEGKTEVGLMRAFDAYIEGEEGIRFAHYGVGTVCGGGGSKVFPLAKLLKKCGYDVCILMDSDISDEQAAKEEAENLNIPVFAWKTGNAIEEQLFLDVDIETANALLFIASHGKRNVDSVRAKLNAGLSHECYALENDVFHLSRSITEEQRRKIGEIAKDKNCEWFKRIDLGQQVGEAVFPKFAAMDDRKGFKLTMTALRKWIANES